MVVTIRTVLIGAGGIGNLHARALEQNDDLELVAIVDPDSTTRAGLADRHKVPGYPHLDDVDATTSYDAAIVAVPTFLHLAVASALATRGKDFLIEKPIHMPHENAEPLLAAIEQQGLVAMVGMTHRYYPEARRAKQLIEAGAIGDLLSIDDHIISTQSRTNLAGWYFNGATSGGGSMFSDGVHAIDRVQWYAGSKIASVESAVTRVLPHTGDVEAYCRTHLHLMSGVPATIMTYWTLAPILDCHLTIVGTRGVLVVESWEGIRLHGSNGYEAVACYPPGLPLADRFVTGLRAEHAAFVSGVKSRRSPVPVSEAVTDMHVLRQIYAEAADSQLAHRGLL